MEKEILEEIKKECRGWKEKVLVRLFPKTFVKAYHVGRIRAVNSIIKVMQ